MNEKLIGQLKRIAIALEKNDCPTMVKTLKESINVIEAQERELDSLYREKAGINL